MGVDPQISDWFLNNTIFTPREQTHLVNALSEMNGVADRGAFVRLALSTVNTTIASFRERQAQMYAGYNKSDGKITNQSPNGLNDETRRRQILMVTALGLLLPFAALVAQTDPSTALGSGPLPSWNDAETKKASWRS